MMQGNKSVVILGLLLLGLLAAGCESKQVLEDKMKEIAGEYVMDSLEGSYPVCPPYLYEKLKIARIHRAGNDWNLDYAIPAPTAGGTYTSCVNVTQKVYWNQIMGQYMVYSKDWSELESTGLSLSDMYYLNVTPTDLTIGSYHWVKQ